MVLLIRKASEEDWQIIQDICTETWLSTYQEILDEETKYLLISVHPASF